MIRVLRPFLYFLPLAAVAQTVVFLEPAANTSIDTSRPGIREQMPLYRTVADSSRYSPWLENEWARRALRLYETAWKQAERSGRQPQEYYVALVPGGNHAAAGFRLETAGGVNDFPRVAYMILGPDEGSFGDTFLHETGHVAMRMLAGGRELPGAEVSSIPHSTAALSDRATAFSEGFAIHLETLAAHLATSRAARDYYHHEAFRFSGAPYKMDEYFRHASDLATYAQTLARYTEVRDNHFAFAPAWRGPDYLRVQLEKARDFSQLRDANQLLQSEGFHATFFFCWVAHGPGLPDDSAWLAREERVFQAMAVVFDAVQPEPDTPWLLYFVQHYLRMFPGEREKIVAAFNDLSHGVFVDPEAGALWRAHYTAALRLDLKGLNRDTILASRKLWNQRVADDPQVIFSRIGPQVPCRVTSVPVKLEAFGDAAPLVFDANTAHEGILQLIPGIRAEQVERWMAERSSKPFSSLEDVRRRTGVKAITNGPLSHGIPRSAGLTRTGAASSQAGGRALSASSHRRCN